MLTPVLPMAALGEGDLVAVRVSGQDILVCNVNGNFHALHARCTHAGQSLANARLHGHEVACPLHGARFDVRTGVCTRAPASAPIRTFPVLIEAGKVCIDL